MASESAYVALLRLPRRELRSVRDFRAVPRVRPAAPAPDLPRRFREGIRVLLAASAARAAFALPLPRLATLHLQGGLTSPRLRQAMPLSRRFSSSSTTQGAACAAWNALIALLPRLECSVLRRIRVFACPYLAASMAWARGAMPLLRAGTSRSCRCSGLRSQSCAPMALEYAYVALLRLPRRATRFVREFRAVQHARPATLAPHPSPASVRKSVSCSPPQRLEPRSLCRYRG